MKYVKSIITLFAVSSLLIASCKAPQVSAEELSTMAEEKAAVKILDEQKKFDTEAAVSFTSKVDARAQQLVAEKLAALNQPK
jgi:hypothetical protein